MVCSSIPYSCRSILFLSNVCLIMIEKNQFPGLEEEAEGFYSFKIIDFITDPGYGYEHVKMFLIRFKKWNQWGLCIWDTKKKEFIEEPGTLEDYEVTLDELIEKYHFNIN